MEIVLRELQNGNVAFGIFCLIAIIGALYVLFSKNVLYASYGLLVSFLGVAGIFVFAGGEFVSAAQIMIYIGGILILLIFGIMLSSNKKMGKGKLNIENMDMVFSLTIAVSLSLLLSFLVLESKFNTRSFKPQQHIKNLGYNLMTDSVLVLEIIGVLLLMALIGATYIAKKDE
ncbi:NADH-quinone oxidoreductase subunit J [Lacihabitans sp. CCS-44]|uniref:NADH-quinone oxidoreductase subunit J family protein n=1 Tax=Lacihabitans sp. CCS-44 TaxID=2487331 RepID=UPI0020CBF121|nr:NADH-quinone oxidoreductase subunit J [Lacihabitans sp. CCS-44]MCP9754306.1 NADH-quinone oxidoreductase subunit J [Lacihabitans sp. CCS-44]